MTTTHMHNHVRDLHDYHNAIFCYKKNYPYNTYNSVSDLSDGDRYTIIAAFIEDIPITDSIEDYLEYDDMQLVKKVLSGAVSKEDLFEALWSCSKASIEEAYEDCVEELYVSQIKSYERSRGKKRPSLIKPIFDLAATGALA